MFYDRWLFTTALYTARMQSRRLSLGSLRDSWLKNNHTEKNTCDVDKNSRLVVNRASKMRQTTWKWIKRILDKATWIVKYPSINLALKYPDSLRPSSYVAFLPCRIQFNRSNSTEIRRRNPLPRFLPHIRLVLLHYPTEMRHRFKRRISAVSNLIQTLC